MADLASCPKCGDSLPADAPEGVCPACELRGALEAEAGQPPLPPLEASGEELPRRFGDYELLEEVARGGMGIVYRARQLSLDRMVAVKLLPFGGPTSAAFIKRFRAEAAAAAALRHPNIVAVHEVGVLQGQHYLVMDFVNGPPFSHVIAQTPLPAGRAAAYLKTVAEAIHHAHERGILHRDLKPSNVLIDENDQPQVTDFGLAKRIDGESSLTLPGQLLGSPNYMPPEQAASEHGQVTRRSDVYGLGAMLYHALTGRPPFQAATLSESVHQILNLEPVSPRFLNPSVPPDLETICLKCLEKEPERRYATAAAMGRELERFLNGEPIEARPIGALGRTWRWCRRKPALATVGTIAGLLLLALAIGGPIVATQQRNLAATNLQLATHERALAEKNRQLSYASSLTAAWQAWDIGNVDGCIRLLEQQPPKPGQPDLREFTWWYLWNLCRPARETPVVTNAVPVWLLAPSPDGTHLAASGAKGTVTLWNMTTREKERQFSTGQPYDGGMAFSPNGRLLVTTGKLPGFGGLGGMLQVWDALTGDRLHVSDLGGCPGDFSPDGRWFAFGVRNDVVVLDAENGWKVHRRWAAHFGEVLEVRWSQDGRRLVSASADHTARVWDSATGRLLGTLKGHTLRVINAAFSHDGDVIVTTSEDKTVRLWNATDCSPLPGEGYTNAVEVIGLAFSTNGQWLATAGLDGLVKLLDRKINKLRTLRGHSRQVTTLQFVLDDTVLVTGSSDATIRFWDLTCLPPNDILEGRAEDERRSPVAFSPDKRTMVTVSPNETEVLRWDVATGTLRGKLPLPAVGIQDIVPPEEWTNGATATIARTAINDLAFAPDGFLAVVRAFNLSPYDVWVTRIELYDFDHNVFVRAMPGDEPIQFSPDGNRLIMQAWTNGPVEMRDRTGRLIWTETELPNAPPRRRTGVAALAVSPDGKWVAAAGMKPEGDRELVLLDATSGKRVKVLESPDIQSPIGTLAFTPGSAYLITAGAEAKIEIWDVAARKLAVSLDGHSSHIRSLAVSPYGRTLVTGDNAGVLKFWSLDRRVELLTLRAHERSIASLCFSPDGQTLASGSQEGIVRLWRADPGP